MREFLVISIGAALGANARYWITNWFADRFGTAFPWGTFVINVSGSFLIGFIIALLAGRNIADPTLRLLLVTGFLGAYTTFSSFSHETLTLIQAGNYLPALLNATASVLIGLLSTLLGIALARLLL